MRNAECGIDAGIVASIPHSVFHIPNFRGADMNDLRYALRSLLKTPGFTSVAVLTLALGIGANAAIFSVVNGVLLRPLPYPEPDRLVWISEAGRGWSGGPIAYPNFVDWRAQQTVFESMGVFKGASYTLVGHGEPELLPAAQMTAGVFRALRVRPALGRVFNNEEDRPGGSPVIVLSHSFWQSRFGGNPHILNRPVTLGETVYTVIGVMPAGFTFPSDDVSIWTPLGPVTANPMYQDRNQHPGLAGVARLKPEVTQSQARAALDAIAARLARQYPETNKDLGAHIVSLLEHQVGNVRQTLWTLLGAVGFVLLIACANVANLLLARAATRQREMAVRSALGAGRWRIIRQLLTESLLLAAAGAAVGVVLAQWSLRLIMAVAQESIPRATEIEVDGNVLLFSATVALLTGIVFGLAPAWQTSRMDLQAPLKEAGRGTVSGRGRLRHALLVTEVAMTLLLLTGAGLLLRSFYHLNRVDPGFVYERLLTFRINVPTQRYPVAKKVEFHQQLLERLRALPGVQAAAAGSQIPFDPHSWGTNFEVDGRPPVPGEIRNMEPHAVSPDYFRAMGIPLLRGRLFTAQDNREHLRGTGREQEFNAGLNVVIVDDQFARRFWPDEDPIGKRIRLPWGPKDRHPVVTVVGTVGHVKLERLAETDGRIQAYFPLFQLPRYGTTYVVKTTTEPESLASAVRRQLFTLDSQLPLYDMGTLAEMRDRSIAPERLNLTLLGIFAAVAVALAAIGVYGVLAYVVTQRRREIGMRMALGAERRDIWVLVVGQGMRLAILGVALGLVASFGLTRVLQNFLYEVKPADPLTFAAVTVFLTVVVLLACYIPARRAARVDPMIALRAD